MSTSEELKARDVAESAREQSWHGSSFIKELFLGRLPLGLLHPFPGEESVRPIFTAFYSDLERFLREVVDPVEIDSTGTYPPRVLKGLAALGAFGMKIPTEYGGLGFTHAEYVKVMTLVGSRDRNVAALLSAHQSIGVPQPVKLFGSDELKEEYLPRCARGAISAFALTEPAVGCDPGTLQTHARLSADGKSWVLNGQKLWCTNGTLAELLVVMARDPATERINAFVVETNWPGVKVEHRCHFMGLKALANAEISFRDVRIPRKNLIGEEGQGLKIALVTLNTGRLTLPAATAGGAKYALEVARKWSQARVQWGKPIGRHEAVAHQISDLATHAFAMESVAELLGHLADREGTDIRLEAAAAKEWNTVAHWKLTDQLLQIRGGRGYETEVSLAARGEPPVAVERLLRDARINLIFEGSSEIMHLFMAREAVDKHLQVAGALVDPRASTGTRLKALPRIAAFYGWWYPTRWLGWTLWPRYREFGELSGHLRFVARASAKLARALFHGMVRYGAKLERKQAFLFRAVDIGMELFALCATISRATWMKAHHKEGAAGAIELADVFASQTRRKVNALFKALWANDDDARTRVAREVMAGKHRWLEHGIVGLPYTIEELTPSTVAELIAARPPPSRGMFPSPSAPPPSFPQPRTSPPHLH